MKRVITGPITIIDDVRRNVTITNYTPRRIVSSVPSCAAMLFALGVSDKVVGVNETSDYPPEVIEKVKASNLKTGKYSQINVELVVSLEPNLILTSGAKVQGALAERLVELGQTLVVLYPETFNDLLENILLVGKVTGQADKAEALVADMRKRLDEKVWRLAFEGYNFCLQ
jgi:iron complex transport system substrate-binding protein